jgi:5'-nucleotidase
VLDLEVAARVAVFLGRRLIEAPLEGDTFLNVNVPAGKPRGIRVTRQGRRDYRPWEMDRGEPGTEGGFWLEEAPASWRRIPDGDYAAIREGWISVSPLHQDFTDREALERIGPWLGAMPGELGG